MRYLFHLCLLPSLLGIHVAVQLGFYYGLWKIFMALFGISNAKAALLLPLAYALLNLI